MTPFDPSDFPPAIAALVAKPRLSPLGPGQPKLAVKAQLDALGDDSNWLPQRVRDRSMADACHAGLFLYHDFLDESHTLSQDLNTVEGSYWHGILHRREPDASNAAYWFRRVGEHPVFKALAKEARELGFRMPSERWNPFDFIDLCEEHRGTATELEMLLCKVQQKEWELLFEFCFQWAIRKE